MSREFELLGPVPLLGGEWAEGPAAGDGLAGWTELRLVLTDAQGTLRVVLTWLDPEMRPLAMSDLITRDRGARQETVQARIEPDATVNGTRWDTEGERNTPGPLGEDERLGVLAVAQGMRRRYLRPG